MSDTLLILILLFFVIKILIFGPLLYWVFREDIRQHFAQKKQQQTVPTCLYCKSRYTEPVDEGNTRWEGDDLVLVTTYECQHCHMPFWHVERVTMPGSGNARPARNRTRRD